MTVTSVNNEYDKAPKSQQRKCLDLRLFDAYGKGDANIFSLKMVFFHGDESYGIPIRIKVTPKTNPMQFVGRIFQTWVEFQGVEAWSFDHKSILQNAATSKNSDERFHHQFASPTASSGREVFMVNVFINVGGSPQKQRNTFDWRDGLGILKEALLLLTQTGTPTYPGKIPQLSPFTPQKERIPKHKLLVKHPGYTFQGYMGEILEITFFLLNICDTQKFIKGWPLAECWLEQVGWFLTMMTLPKLWYHGSPEKMAPWNQEIPVGNHHKF